MLRKFIALSLFLCFVFSLTSCNRYEGQCDHCSERKQVSLRLADSVDLQLCDDCYAECCTHTAGSDSDQE